MRAVALLVTCAAVALAGPAAAQPSEPVDPRASEPPAVAAGTDSGVTLRAPAERQAFSFAIFGDRTGGERGGLQVLRDAVRMTNDLDPDLVLTVGDLVQGYNRPGQWLAQMRDYKRIMGRLDAPWYPVAGNHDVYARPTRPGGHVPLYKEHFGPLYYSFDYRWAHFVVLFSDESLSYRDPGRTQNMSPAQLEWLRQDLAATEAKQVFVFLHHPRWTPRYRGSNWPEVHRVLRDDGRVAAVFAGHIHQVRDDGVRDGIHYYTLATTGGARGKLDAVAFHHIDLVRVRPDGFRVSVLPVGAALPGDVVQGAEVDALRGLSRGGWVAVEGGVRLAVERGERSTFRIELDNPTDRPLEVDATLRAAPGWTLQPAALKARLEAGAERAFEVEALSPPLTSLDRPRLAVQATATYRLASGREQRLTVREDVPLDLTDVATWAAAREGRNGVLLLEGDGGLRVPLGPAERDLASFTLECWVRGEPPTGRTALITNTESSSFGLFWSERSERPRGLVHLRGQGYTRLTAARPWTFGRWTHLALVRDAEAGRLRLFVGGEPAGDVACAGDLTTNDLPLWIGADPDRRGRPVSPFRGAVDEVRLSRVARYAAPFTPADRHEADADTLLLLRCDAAVAGLVPDHSGRGLHGRLSGKARIAPGRDWQ